MYDYEYKLNDKGQIVEEVTINENEVVAYADLWYLSNGQLLFKKEYDKNYENHGEHDRTAEYDDRGNLIRDLTIWHNNATTETMKTYDSDSKVLTDHTVLYYNGRKDTEFKTNYVYTNGLLESSEFIHLFPKNNAPVRITTYEHDRTGNLVMSSTYSSPGQTTFGKYDYNSLGLLLKETRYGENDSVKVFTNDEYDANNLLIRKSYGNSGEHFWEVNEFDYFANGKLKRSVSYFKTSDVLSTDKKPEIVKMYDERGNQVESSSFDISEKKIRYTRTSYTCRD